MAYKDKSKQRANSRKSSAKRRHEVLQAYGGRCACCGETTEVFLTIDHIFNDGAVERKAGGSGTSFYASLKKRKFPPGYQVLCRNCNWAKHVLGTCPHHGA